MHHTFQLSSSWPGFLQKTLAQLQDIFILINITTVLLSHWTMHLDMSLIFAIVRSSLAIGFLQEILNSEKILLINRFFTEATEPVPSDMNAFNINPILVEESIPITMRTQSIPTMGTSTITDSTTGTDQHGASRWVSYTSPYPSQSIPTMGTSTITDSITPTGQYDASRWVSYTTHHRAYPPWAPHITDSSTNTEQHGASRWVPYTSPYPSQSIPTMGT